jgi:WD40 repeat protein
VRASPREQAEGRARTCRRPRADRCVLWPHQDTPIVGWSASDLGQLEVDEVGRVTHIAIGEVARGGSIWDLTTGDRLATLTGHTGEVFDVAFSPDGDTIATAGADGTARLWDTETGTEQLVLHSDEGPVSSVAFSPDGDRLVTTSVGVARVWALDLEDLIGIAEDRLTRSLTDDECRQYLHVDACPSRGETSP